MNLFKRIFKKQENPYLVMLKPLLPKEYNLEKNDIYYIIAFEHTKENIQNLDESINNNTLLSFFNSVKYNSQKDNIGVYWLKNKGNIGDLYFITDSLEPYEREQVLKCYKYQMGSNIFNLDTVEKIN